MSFASEKNTDSSGNRSTADTLNIDLQSAANQAGRKVRGMIDSASDEICQATDKLRAEISIHPVQATVIALGVGMLIGTLFRR